MSNKLFVGGLAWATTDESLRAAFEPYGEVLDAKVITDRETGRSRGFGFVTFGEAESAQKAIAQMDGSAIDGRNVRVNEAQERSRGGPGGPRGRGGPGGGDRRGPGGRDRDRPGPRAYPPVERRASAGGGGGGGAPAAGFMAPDPFAEEGKPQGRKRHNGGGKRRRGREGDDVGGGGRRRGRRDFDDRGSDW